jgi:putative peptidoglycan lipid II flippase
MQPEAGIGTGAHHTAEPLARSAGLAGAATLTSRVLGVIRDTVLAAIFGAGNEMDAFLVAFRIPNLARDLFAEGAMSAAFVPTFTEHLTRQGRDSSWRLGNNMLNTLLLITGALVVIALIFAEPLVTAYAGEYAAVPGKLELAIQLTKIMLPFLMLVAAAAVVMGMLNSLHHYFIPSLSPATFNVASIACAIGLAPLMVYVGQPPIVAMAIATLLGGLGQVALQWVPLTREGFRYKPFIDLSDPGLRRVLLLMGPGTFGLAATQVNLFVTTDLAAGQGTGAVSWLNYAFRLMYLPIGLFGVSIATAVLPRAARHAAERDLASVRTVVSHGLSLMFMVNVPAMLGLIVLATPIVRLLFEHGRFTPDDTAATASALRFYALGLIGYSAVRIVTPVFYAVGRNRIPVFVSTAAIVANLVLSIILVNTLGFRGLALATSIAAVVNGGLLLVLLRGVLGHLDSRQLLTALLKVTLAALVMAAAVVGVQQAASPLFAGGTWLQAAGVGLAIATGLVTLGVCARLLAIAEFDELWRLVLARFQRRRRGR